MCPRDRLQNVVDARCFDIEFHPQAWIDTAIEKDGRVKQLLQPVERFAKGHILPMDRRSPPYLAR